MRSSLLGDRCSFQTSKRKSTMAKNASQTGSAKPACEKAPLTPEQKAQRKEWLQTARSAILNWVKRGLEVLKFRAKGGDVYIINRRPDKSAISVVVRELKGGALPVY